MDPDAAFIRASNLSSRASGLVETLIQLCTGSPQDIDAIDLGDLVVLLHKQLMLVSLHDVTFARATCITLGQVESLIGGLSGLHAA